MFKNRITILFTFLVVNSTYGQSLAKRSDSNMYSQIGKENVFIHYNASLLFVGEYLYYSVYCLNQQTAAASDISKMAYVELVDEKGMVVFRQKIALKDGKGQGDFFIPVSVPSGNYKLIGYTQWMFNWGEESFFQDDISILNPYTNAQRHLLSDQDGDTIKTEREPRIKAISAKDDNKWDLSLVKDTLTKREKVVMILRSKDGESSYGRCSISVRKYDSLYNVERTNASFFKKELNQNSEELRPINIVLPEMRGDLLSGTIRTDKPHLPLDNQKVLFSIPGEEYRLKVLTTNEKGDFNFSLSNGYSGNTASFQILGNDRGNYTIELKQKARLDYSNFVIKKFVLNPKMEEMIVERSVHNQIENAYFSAKPDTIGTVQNYVPFYGKDAIIYNLDDYTRFSTFKETLVEIIGDIGISKDESGRPTLVIRSRDYTSNKIGYQPLVIVDGHVLQDVEKLIQYDIRKIKTISIKKNLYISGGHIFQGIIDVKTFESDYQFDYDSHVKEYILLKPLENKKYFKQVYTPENAARLKNIPDYRHQLLWLPNFELERGIESIELFTSDVPGNYEISLEGFTFSGNPVSIKKIFTVK